MKKFFLSLSAAAFLFGTSYAQTTATASTAPVAKPGYKPMKFSLNEDGSQYIRLITWMQFWAMNVSTNTGTVGVDGKPISSNFDFGIRRARMLAYAQLNKNWLILTHFGINNQTFSTGGVNGTDGKKPQMYIHDAWTEFVVAPKKLSIGTGLHYWNGVSRLANASTLNFMTMDAPIFNWYVIETNDQFARQMGVYAKGQLGKLDYRLALNKPFSNGLNPYTAPVSTIAQNAYNPGLSTQGYVKYMFKDQESNFLPFEVGTYLGAKKVFNIGLGFYNQKGATYTKTANSSDSVKLHDNRVLGLDVFYDAPVGTKGASISAYGLYQSMDFGPNYLRYLGIMNTAPTIGTNANLGADSTLKSTKAGNLQPTIGTGSIIYAQVGYKLPNFKNGAALMPYASFTNKSFDAIGEASNQFALGANYFISGHNCKITAEYATRPQYKFDVTSATGVSQNGSKGQFTIQTHIFL